MFTDKQVDHKLPLQLQTLHLKWHFFILKKRGVCLSTALQCLFVQVLRSVKKLTVFSALFLTILGKS